MADTDIYETFNYGYDPSVPERIPLEAPPKPATAPGPSAYVDTTYLPPVGHQTTPSCFVWSSTYGCATFAAAQQGKFQPKTTSNQASPDYTYIQILIELGMASDTCTGGQILSCFEYLNSKQGTPNIGTAEIEVGCDNAWSNYGGGGLQADGRFQVLAWKGMPLNNGAAGLANMRTVIAAGTPIAYGTYLYTDFPPYKGSPSPYVGNGQWLYSKTDPTKKVGHCMMIIGYNDDMPYGDNKGAVLIQNSFGTSWGSTYNGSGGYVWMAYDTFQTMAEGGGLYITSIASGGGG
jgi:hypothetical protein